MVKAMVIAVAALIALMMASCATLDTPSQEPRTRDVEYKSITLSDGIFNYVIEWIPELIISKDGDDSTIVSGWDYSFIDNHVQNYIEAGWKVKDTLWLSEVNDIDKMCWAGDKKNWPTVAAVIRRYKYSRITTTVADGSNNKKMKLIIRYKYHHIDRDTNTIYYDWHMTHIANY